MSPPRRLLRKVFLVLWVLVCLDLLVIWVRSYWVSEAVCQTRYSAADASSDPPGQSAEVQTSFGAQNGEIVSVRSARVVNTAGEDTGWEWIHPPVSAADYGPSLLNRCGFAVATQQIPGESSVQVFIPIWALFTLAMIPLLGRVIFRLARKKA